MKLSNKYIRIVMQILILLITIPFKMISYFTPKKKNIWIFGNTYGYKDNSKYLYEYVYSNDELKIRPIWISKKKHFKVLGEGYYYLSFKGLYFQYICSVVCLTTGMNDVAKFTLGNKFIVQLWHGIPIKKLLLDSKESIPSIFSNEIFDKFLFYLLKIKLSRYDLLCASDKSNQQCLSKAFGLSYNKIPITGTPRQEIIKYNKNNREHKNNKVLIALTWQDTDEKALKWISFILTKRLMEFSSQNDIIFDVIIHPLNNKVEKLIKNNRVNILKPDDINLELHNYDLLITDFSSIAFDFSLLKRPVLFSAYDVSEYINDRGIYENYLDYIDNNNLSNNELINKLDLYFNHNQLLSILDVDTVENSPMLNIITEIRKRT